MEGLNGLELRNRGDFVLKLLDRGIAAVEQRLVLLAPPEAKLPKSFMNVVADPGRRTQLIRQMQEVRGSIYLSEGNVQQSQLCDGRHQTPEDVKSWHLLMTDADGAVSSCAWYLEHQEPTGIDSLRLRNCPLAKSPEWGEKLDKVVKSEIRKAKRFDLRYTEVGGWAVSKARRCSSEGLILALAAYGLSQIRGGAIGITTANVTHSSSSILRRLGGSYLHHGKQHIPEYFDVRYNTKIELLRFDSRNPDPKFKGIIDSLRERLSRVLVVADHRQTDAQLDDTGPIALPPSLIGRQLHA